MAVPVQVPESGYKKTWRFPHIARHSLRISVRREYGKSEHHAPRDIGEQFTQGAFSAGSSQCISLCVGDLRNCTVCSPCCRSWDGKLTVPAFNVTVRTPHFQVDKPGGGDNFDPVVSAFRIPSPSPAAGNTTHFGTNTSPVPAASSPSPSALAAEQTSKRGSGGGTVRNHDCDE